MSLVVAAVTLQNLDHQILLGASTGVKGVARICHVDGVHPGNKPTLACICSSKNRCAHPSKKVKPLRASVTLPSLARIRHEKDPSAHH